MKMNRGNISALCEIIRSMCSVLSIYPTQMNVILQFCLNKFEFCFEKVA